MGTNLPWNLRLTVPKTIKVMLVRPLMTDFKMTVRADRALSACSPRPQPIQPYTLTVRGRGGWSAFGQALFPLPHIASIQIKQTFPSTNISLSGLFNSEQLNPTFGYKGKQSPQQLRLVSEHQWGINSWAWHLVIQTSQHFCKATSIQLVHPLARVSYHLQLNPW